MAMQALTSIFRCFSLTWGSRQSDFRVDDDMLMNAAAPAIYGSSYFAATADIPMPRAPLAHDLDVDVCVIGGGLAGLTTAREVARRGWSVALLEAQRIAWNASGRNTGFVLPGFGQDPEHIVERVGIKRAQALWALAQAGLDYVRETVAEPGMSGIDPTERMALCLQDRQSRGDGGLCRILRELGTDIETWPTALVRSKLKTEHYFRGDLFSDRRSTFIPSITRSGLRGSPNRRARASSRTRRLCRSIRPACASAL